ncbi:uncharacterized protein LOC108917082 [Anoplophora glabripennis]|uniref:uncharacterized protein LOC108917082 n=1 Tax=Anoplophora glabripennis TaxID=217634 RepID=UPI000874B706|nr:uncharacterized protein LOC108917082 [Anoplophora glabripennis]
MADKDTFLTTTRQEYKWPYAKPIVAGPSQPPITTKPNNHYVAQLVEPYCHCDAHLYEPEMGRYKKLANKEKRLYQELDELNKEMATLAGGIIDHPCDNDDIKMETIYQTDYIKRGLPLASYRKLMPAIDSPTGVPVKGETVGLGSGYRDPTKFRYSAFTKPMVNVCPQVTFTRTPTLVDEWFAPRTGTTEYHDNISNMAMNILKSTQQYAEPLPSSRRKRGDLCT